MTIKFTKNAAEDIEYWKKRDSKIFKRIKLLLTDITQNPYEGIGKPECLRYNLSGKWSRRITREHHLVYEIIDEDIIIHQCKNHY